MPEHVLTRNATATGVTGDERGFVASDVQRPEAFTHRALIAAALNIDREMDHPRSRVRRD